MYSKKFQSVTDVCVYGDRLHISGYGFGKKDVKSVFFITITIILQSNRYGSKRAWKIYLIALASTCFNENQTSILHPLNFSLSLSLFAIDRHFVHSIDLQSIILSMRVWKP